MKFKKVISLAVATSVLLTSNVVFAKDVQTINDTTNEIESSKDSSPEISLSYDDSVNTIEINSDMDGLLSVSSATSSDIIVESRKITKNQPVMVSVDTEVDTTYVATVRPESSDLTNPNTTGVKTIDVAKNSTQTKTASTAQNTNPNVDKNGNVWAHVLTGSASEKSTDTYSSVGSINDSFKISSRSTDTKIESSKDSLNFYYTEVPSNTDFTISGQMTITKLDQSSSNQSFSGFIVKDSLAGEKGEPMVFAGANPPAYTKENSLGFDGKTLVYRKNDSSISDDTRLGSQNFEVGRTYNIELQKIGNTYYSYIDGKMTSTSENLGFEGDNLFVGATTTRAMESVFSNVVLNKLDTKNKIESLEVTKPNNTNYLQNSKPNTDGLKVMAVYTDGKKEVVEKDYAITNLSTDKVGEFNFKVTYLGQSVQVPYSVRYDNIEKLEVINMPIKINYAIGEQLDSRGLVIRETRESGKTSQTNNYTLSKLESNNKGSKTITVNVNDTNNTNNKTKTTFKVNVLNKTVDSLSLVKKPIKSVYYVDDVINSEEDLLVGTQIEVNYSDKSKDLLVLAEKGQVGYTTNYDSIKDSFTKTSQNINLVASYEGKSVNIPFEIKEVTKDGLVAKAYPSKTTYFLNEDVVLDGLEVQAINSNGTKTDTLVLNKDYVVEQTKVKKDTVGLYSLDIKGIGDYDKLTGTIPVSYREYKDYQSGFQSVVFGQSTDASKTSVTVEGGEVGTIGDNVSVRLNALTSGKIADGHDGLLFYYNKLNIEDNFKLSATVKVNSFSNPDGKTAIYSQEAFGLMIHDMVGPNGDSSVWPSSMMFAGGGRTDTTPPPFTAYYRDNRSDYIDGVTAKNIAIEQTGGDALIFDRKPENEKETVADIIIEKRNNNFSGSITVGNEVRKFNFDNDIPFDYYDKDNYYVGFFTARNADVTFSNAKLTVTDSRADINDVVLEEERLTPTLKINSANKSPVNEYDFIYNTNVKGEAKVYYNSELVSTQKVEPYKLYTYTNNLLNGENKNGYSVVLSPDVTEHYSSYDDIIESISVDVIGVDEDIYVSPNGAGDGTIENPMSFDNAIYRLKPNQKIILTEGSYPILTIPQYNNGSKTDGYKQLIAQDNVTIKGLNVYGNYWHVKGLNISGGGSIHVGGSENVVELCTVKGSLDTGIYVSRFGDKEVYSTIDTWPKNNIFLNCESYDNRDSAENDADGFSAKLTVGGGNKFIGCVAHHNIDDGWDLYAKSVVIGEVVVDSCISYRNGYTIQEFNNGGDGNGFKLGGEGVPVNHVLKNSIAFENKNNGIASNSNPTLTLDNNVSFDNYKQNISLVSYNNINIRDYKVTNMFSYSKNVKPADADIIEKIVDGKVSKTDGRTIGNNSVYLNDSEGKSYNESGRVVTDKFFENVQSPQKDNDIFFEGTKELNKRDANKGYYSYSFDEKVVNDIKTEKTNNYKSAINDLGFLKLTEFAYKHNEKN